MEFAVKISLRILNFVVWRIIEILIITLPKRAILITLVFWRLNRSTFGTFRRIICDFRLFGDKTVFFTLMTCSSNHLKESSRAKLGLFQGIRSEAYSFFLSSKWRKLCASSNPFLSIFKQAYSLFTHACQYSSVLRSFACMKKAILGLILSVPVETLVIALFYYS